MADTASVPASPPRAELAPYVDSALDVPPDPTLIPRPRAHVTISLTRGCDGPLALLRDAPQQSIVAVHPCDEPVVTHLLGHLARVDLALHPDTRIPPGWMRVS